MRVTWKGNDSHPDVTSFSHNDPAGKPFIFTKGEPQEIEDAFAAILLARPDFESAKESGKKDKGEEEEAEGEAAEPEHGHRGEHHSTGKRK